ncbi:hypothetical protein EV2_008556 [Malus domestica]
MSINHRGGEKSFAEDVAVDAEGNAYVTDCTASKIWKVGADGKLLSTIRSPLFRAKDGKLLKIDLAKGEEVKLIEVAGGPLTFGDGRQKTKKKSRSAEEKKNVLSLEEKKNHNRALLSPTKLVVAGSPSGRLVESSDGWETASVVAKFSGTKHRLATAATMKTHESWTHRSSTTAIVFICRLDVVYGVIVCFVPEVVYFNRITSAQSSSMCRISWFIKAGKSRAEAATMLIVV